MIKYITRYILRQAPRLRIKLRRADQDERSESLSARLLLSKQSASKNQDERAESYAKLLVVFSVLFLFGCTPYQPWLKDVFNQGESIDPQTTLVRQYRRTEHVYDQFDTLGHFTALWLSDEVRQVYSQVYACKYCFNEQQYRQLQQEQFAENSNYISFYVLTAMPSCNNSLLSDEDPEWSVCLSLGGRLYSPLEIAEVQLPPEYMLFFGKTYTRFKSSFLVKFSANDESGESLLKLGICHIDLVFSRPDRKVYLTWCLDAHGRVIRRDVKKDPDVLFYDLECCS